MVAHCGRDPAGYRIERQGDGQWRLWRDQQLLDIDTDDELALIFEWAGNVLYEEDRVDVRQWVKKSGPQDLLEYWANPAE